MNQVLTYWPLITGIVAIAGGVFGFVVALLRIKQLRLSVEKLEKEVRASQENIYRPTIEEIEKYGKVLEDLTRTHERSYHRQAELTQQLREITNEQVGLQAEVEEHIEKSLRSFDEAENRIYKLRQELKNLSKELEQFR